MITLITLNDDPDNPQDVMDPGGEFPLSSLQTKKVIAP